jgi:hypothetical protein
MKIRNNKRLGGNLMMAAGGLYFIAALTMHQPAFSGIGAGLFVIGVAIRKKADKTGC